MATSAEPAPAFNCQNCQVLSILDNGSGFLVRRSFCREFGPSDPPNPLANRVGVGGAVGFETIHKLCPFVDSGRLNPLPEGVQTEPCCRGYQSLIVSRPGNREAAMPSSYVIGEHFEQFIKGQIQQGRYASASEVIRDGLRALEDREKLRALKLDALRADIQQGINSGPGSPVQEVTAELQARYQQWAEQGAPADAL